MFSAARSLLKTSQAAWLILVKSRRIKNASLDVRQDGVVSHDPPSLPPRTDINIIQRHCSSNTNGRRGKGREGLVMKIRAGSHLGPSIEYVRRIPEGLSLTPPFPQITSTSLFKIYYYCLCLGLLPSVTVDVLHGWPLTQLEKN